MTPIDTTLDERNGTHGDFTDQARTARLLKAAMRASAQWFHLADDQQEALDMIAGKISRALTGNPDHADHWHDIAGYARLIERRLESACATTASIPSCSPISGRGPNG